MPAKVARHHYGHDSSFAIECRQQFLYVDDLGLDLYQEQGAAGRKPRQDVNGSAFAANVEGVLDPDLPTQPNQVGYDMLDDGGVALIDQPGQIGAPPSRFQLQPDVDGSSHRAERADCQLSKVTPFHEGSRALAHAREQRNVELAEAAPQSNRTNRGSDPNVFHGGIFAVGHWPRIICR